MSILRQGITVLLFPVVFVGAMVVGIAMLRRGYDAGAVLAVVAPCVALIVAVFERIHPAHERWKRSHGDLGTDSIHMLVSNIVLPRVMDIGMVALLVHFAAEGAGGGLGLWPSNWPLAAQLLLAMPLTQLPEYWWHRLCHTVPILWRFHAVHHSAPRLYWLNAGRFHPVDTFVAYGISLVTLHVVGAGAEVVVLLTIWIAVHGLFQHSNIHLRLGPLNWIFSMAELHRWHHSKRLEEANNNYGNNILLWDIVFGTVYWPSDRDASDDIGLADRDDYPAGYLGQLAEPFRR